MNSATVAGFLTRSARSRIFCHERFTAAKSASRGCSSRRSSGLERSARSTTAFQASELPRRHAFDVLRLRKHVQRLHARQFKDTVRAQDVQIPRHRRRGPSSQAGATKPASGQPCSRNQAMPASMRRVASFRQGPELALAAGVHAAAGRREGGGRRGLVAMAPAVQRQLVAAPAPRLEPVDQFRRGRLAVKARHGEQGHRQVGDLGDGGEGAHAGGAGRGATSCRTTQTKRSLAKRLG